jgi:proline iminopeptidase
LTDGSFERNGVRLYYRTQGTGAPLVLLSGGPGFDVVFLFPLGELFPKTHRLIYLEQRGTGRSVVAAPSRSTVNMNEAIDDLEGLRRHLQVERLLLAGHSYGGMLAMAYAAKYPTRVERLLLIASGGPTLRMGTWFGANIRARLRYEEREEQKYWEGEMAAGRVSKQTGANKVQAVATPTYFFDRDKGLAFVRSAGPEPLNVLTNELI